MRTKSAPQAPGPAAAFDEKELQPTREATEEKKWPYVSAKDRDSFLEQWPAQCYGYKNREFEQEANTEKETEPRRQEKAEQEEPHGRGPDGLSHFGDPQVEAEHQEHESEPGGDVPWPMEPEDDLAEFESLEAEAEAAAQKEEDRQ